MKIKFEHMTIHNFMSFLDTSISFDECGYVLITGTNHNTMDNASSNGSGKSAIWEAITWCLTGETIRGFKNVSNQFVEDDGCYVRLKFRVDNNAYEIIRAKDSKEYKSNLKLWVDGEDKSGKGIRDTEKILQAYLPDITPSLLGSVIILGQGLPERFTNNTPSGRKEILEKLIKSDFMIADLKTRIATRKDYLSSLSKKYSDIDISKSSMLNVIDKNIVNATSKLNSMKDVDINKTLVDAEKQLLAKKTERLNEVIEQLNNLNDEKMMLDKEKGDVSTNLNNEIFKLKEENSSNVSTLNTEGASLQTRISMIHREIARLDSITDICPTCGQKLPDVTKVDTTSLKEEKESLSINLASIRDKLNEEARLHANKVREVENKYSDSLKNLTSKLDTLSSYIRTLNDEEKSLKNSIHEHELSIMKLNMEIESYEQRREEIQKEIDENIYNKKLIEEELLYNHKEREVVEKRLAIINKFNSVISRDFRGILLSSAIEYIDKQSKLYCKDIFDTNGIEFTLCGNNISISYNGKEYECLSGGERQKIDLIVQFSIRDMLCKFMNFSANILVLDEITDNLDMTGCQRVLNLISNKLSDVENIYIISHRQDLKIPFDKKILVEKTTEGISVIHS